jgi:hypothetical protein
MNLDSWLVASPGGFRQTSRIALGQRTGFNEALRDQVTGRCNGFRRRASRGEIFLTVFGAYGTRS